jgi:DNA polymerase-1
MNALLQAGEAVVMKLAIGDFGNWLDDHYTAGADYGLCGFIHDELQIECRPEIADELGQRFAQCITEAGVKLGVKCPMAGSPSKGPTWADTH